MKPGWGVSKVFSVYSIICFFNKYLLILVSFCFVIVRNFTFLPWIILWKSSSFKFQKGNILLEQETQYQAQLSFWRYLKVWVLILLHLIWIRNPQLSHSTALPSFVTGLLHVLHGNIAGIFFHLFFLGIVCLKVGEV